MSISETNTNQTDENTNPQTSEEQAGDSAYTKNKIGEQAPYTDQRSSVVKGTASPENKGETLQRDHSSKISTANNPINNLQSLPTVVVGVDEKPDVKEPSLPIIGFNLSTFVLCIISGFILFLAIYLSTKQFEASSLIQMPMEANISDSTFSRKIELIRMIQEEKKSYREFTVQMSQMVLLNLLLPVLTAILGYIFASNKNNSTNA